MVRGGVIKGTEASVCICIHLLYILFFPELMPSPFFLFVYLFESYFCSKLA